MATLDIVLAVAALAFVLVLAIYFSFALVTSRRAELAETNKAVPDQETARHPSPSSARPRSSARAGAFRQPAPTPSAVDAGAQPRSSGQNGQDPAARGTWDLYAHSSPRWREPATYRVRASGQGAPKWNPYAEEQSSAHRVRARRHRRPQLPRLDDHYALLGLDRDATPDQIERAYRRHAALIHPDRFFDDPFRRTEAEKKLKQLNAVMQILRDPVRRAQYDERLSRREIETRITDEE